MACEECEALRTRCAQLDEIVMRVVPETVQAAINDTWDEAYAGPDGPAKDTPAPWWASLPVVRDIPAIRRRWF